MKKIWFVALALILALNGWAVAEETPVRVAALMGPTGMGMVKMMADDEETGAYEFTLAGSADMVTPGLVRGEIDIACVPANLGAVLYEKMNGGVNVLAVNTLGVIYMVERGETISTMEDLKGRTIYASGRGATPEYALNYLLSAHGIDPEKDLTIEYKSEHAECLTALVNDANAIAMLPQPFVTVAQNKVSDLRIALDFSHEWDLLQEGSESPSGMITGIVIARRAFIDEHPEQVAAFMEAYAASVEYVNANVDEAAKLIDRYGIVAENVARQALPYCNIVCIRGEEMKTKLAGYLEVLCQQNPSAVGGKVPDEAFYFAE